MEDVIKEKISMYCEKCNMKMNNFSIKTTKDGYIATDKYTSIMFDKEGKASSLPMYVLYGNNSTQLLGKGYAFCMCITIALILIAGAVYSFLK